MKNIIFFITFLSFIFLDAQNCVEQEKVIEIIINKNSLKEFFKNRKEIIISNSQCNESKRELKDRKIILKFKKSKVGSEKSITFLEYETTKKIIFVELSLFNNNVIYSAIFKKNNNQLVLINGWTTFIKFGN